RPATRWRAGSRATATSCSRPTFRLCGGSPGSKARRSSSATSAGRTARPSSRRRGRCFALRSTGHGPPVTSRWWAPSSSSTSCSITFMAKPDDTWIGRSCHIPASLWRDGENAFAGESEVFGQFLAGWIAGARELALFLAPTINSYKRYAAGSWAPTTLAWGHDNRTCGFRIVGHGNALRAETRIPGADANPYLAFAALLAAGLYGIENRLELPPAFEGNAYESD